MSFPDPNPFERDTFNLTRAVQLASAEPEKARAQFKAAERRGTLGPGLAKAEAELFPPAAADPYAWVDELSA
jgi:hypothetical protein